MFNVCLLSLSLIYSLFILWCWWGWVATKRITNKESNFKTRVSVIVAVRNEEENIGLLLSDLVAQNFPVDLLEIIIVNDHSTDNTAPLVNKFITEHVGHTIRLLDLEKINPRLFSKKAAITEAVKVATGELIITTDGDCRAKKNWLASMVSHYEREQPFMITAPVLFSCNNNWFEKIESLEFMGLIAIGAGSIRNGHPLMCNGANLAFTKEIFDRVNGYSHVNMLATGDDTQLMLKISKVDNSKIVFLKSEDAIVSTSAKASWKEMFHQKKRWASKIPYQMSVLAIFVATVAYLLNACLISGFILILAGHQPAIFILAFLLKLSSEYLLLNSASTFMKKRRQLWWVLSAEIYYPFYVIVIGITSLTGSYEWKGRKIKR